MSHTLAADFGTHNTTLPANNTPQTTHPTPTQALEPTAAEEKKYNNTKTKEHEYHPIPSYIM